MPLSLDNIAGDDDIGFDDVGFRLPSFLRRGGGRWAKRRTRARQGPPGRPALPSGAAAIMPSVPGVPARTLGLFPAAFPPATFALATGTNVITVNMNPQAPFVGARLVAQVVRNGASAAATAPILTDLRVGMVPAVTTVDGVPVEIFAPNAVDTTLKLPPTTPGVLYQASMRLTTALTGTDTLIVLLSIVGGSWQ